MVPEVRKGVSREGEDNHVVLVVVVEDRESGLRREPRLTL